MNIGIKHDLHQITTIYDEKCDNCTGTTKQVKLIVKYFAFLIPIILLKRNFISICLNCKTENNYIVANDNSYHSNLSNNVKIKYLIKYSIGGILSTFIIISIVLYLTFVVIDRHKFIINHINFPKIGDIYIVDGYNLFNMDNTGIIPDKKYDFTMLRLISINNNSYTFVPSVYKYDDSIEAFKDIHHRMKDTQAWHNDTKIEIYKFELLLDHNNKYIYNILRIGEFGNE